MDRKGPKLLISLAFLTGICGAVWATEANQSLRAVSWLSEEGKFEALTTEPAVSFRIDGRYIDRSNEILTGEALFNTPSLLGGQAAKAAISCASCHVNGRNNPHFKFPGISGRPGTADATHSFFSSHRGDDEFNPVPIPDLTKPGKVSHSNAGELEKFVRGLIVEEFNGIEPSENAVKAISIYIRALCQDCESEPQPITLDTHWKRAERALILAEKYRSKEPDLSRLLLFGVRHQLGLVFERYSGGRLADERNSVLELSRKVAELRNAIGADGVGYPLALGALMEMMIKTNRKLSQSEHQSLYNPEKLRSHLEDNSKKPN